MSFNPVPSKQVQKLTFTHKVKRVVHPPIFFNNKPDQKVSSQKHLGFSKTIGLLRKLNNRLPRSCLTTIYKSFVGPHLDYIDVIFDKTYNNSFQERLESLQYKPLLAITDANKDSLTGKLYQELRLESLQNRQWFRKLCVFYKIVV